MLDIVQHIAGAVIIKPERIRPHRPHALLHDGFYMTQERVIHQVSDRSFIRREQQQRLAVQAVGHVLPRNLHDVPPFTLAGLGRQIGRQFRQLEP